MIIDINDVEKGAVKAFEGHSSKPDVKEFKKNLDINIDVLYNALIDGSYIIFLHYRKLTKINNDGKVRHIDSPSLITRIYQHTFMLKMRQLYDNIDPNVKHLININSYTNKVGIWYDYKNTKKVDLSYRIVINIGDGSVPFMLDIFIS